MDDTQKQAIEALKLCEHGNYHCMICEVRLLKLVIAEQSEEIEKKDAELEYRKKYESFLKSCIACGETLEHSGYDKFEHWLEKYMSISEPKGVNT